MERRPHILVINSKTLLPNIDGATIRSTQMLQMLAETCDIDLVYTCSKDTLPADESPLYNYCQKVKGFTTSTFGMITRGLLGLFSSKPLECCYLYSQEAQLYIDAHLNEYDFVFCNNVRAAQYVVGKKCRKIIDYVDALSMRYQGEIKKADWIRKIIYTIEYKRLEHYETRILNEFDGHFIISDVDKQHILRNANSTQEIYVVNNSTELRQCINQPDGQDLVFVGFHMEWVSIRENTNRFYEETGFADERIVSEQGFSADDVQKIAAIPGVRLAARFVSAAADVAGQNGDTVTLTVTENPSAPNRRHQ